MSNVLVVGSLNMDLVVRMPAIPRPGETLLGGRFATFPGGKGANQAVAAARLGAHVVLVGKVGIDAFGQQILQGIQLEGIDARYIGIEPDTATGVALITVDSKGENSISVASGANFALTANDVSAALSQIRDIDVLVMPLETPMETIVVAAQRAKTRGIPVILNPAPAQALDADLLRNIDVIVPNASEAEHLTGKAIHSAADALQAGMRLLNLGVRNVVLTLGENGALLVEGGNGQPTHTVLPAYEVKAVDTTAAGDCFVGALATGLAEKLPLAEAAGFANAAAALSVTRLGAQPSLPRRQELDSFLQDRRQCS